MGPSEPHSELILTGNCDADTDRPQPAWSAEDGGSMSCESGMWCTWWRPSPFIGRHRGLTTWTTQQPYLLWFLCLSCQGSLSQCPLRDTGRRPLAQANCWLCPPWFHTSAPPSAAGASLGQTGAWLWWAMKKVIFFCWRWKWNSQATRKGGLGWGTQTLSSVQHQPLEREYQALQRGLGTRWWSRFRACPVRGSQSGDVGNGWRKSEFQEVSAFFFKREMTI